jgi:hypothetical protein
VGSNYYELGGAAVEIDRMRIAAVGALEALGYVYESNRWLPATIKTAPLIHLTAEADVMHAALVRRSDALAACLEGEQEEAELRLIADALDAYESKRWPLGRDPAVSGGKG